MPPDRTGVTTNGLANLQFTADEQRYVEREAGRFPADQDTIVVSSALLQNERVAVDPRILGGAPHIRGTRIPISVILDGLVEGASVAELIENYPRLTKQDVYAVLAFAAESSLLPGTMEG